jgi:DtxR family Mn-dependent transcriptional regulator
MDLNTLHSKFPAAADYLSQIFLIKREYGQVNNIRLSERLGVSKSAVTQSIKRLAKLELVHQDRYGVIQLTEEGNDLAKDVLERHYLLEHVLVDMLGYPWEKSDREAKRLQDIISEDLTRHMEEQLGRPKTCPHGNPFPDTKREEELIEAPRLVDALVGEDVTLIRITEEGEEVDGLLDFCFRRNLKPGTPLRLLSRTNDGLEVRKKTGGDNFRIPLEYARHFCYAADSGSNPGVQKSALAES